LKQYLTGLAKRLYRFAGTHGPWGLLFALIVAVIFLTLRDPQDSQNLVTRLGVWVQVASAIGAIGAAIAAFTALERQINRENEEKKPSLLASDISVIDIRFDRQAACRWCCSSSQSCFC
jgi:uncharacterized oligopeptide transporter (OPT) family protein